MKRSMNISTALLLSLAAFACTKKNSGMDGNNSRPEPTTQSTPSPTTPSSGTGTGSATGTGTTGTDTTTGTGTTGSTGTQMNAPATTANCPDPNQPGYDASKVDPSCPRPGSDVPPPATGTPDATRPTTPP